ncbi:DUF5683 domain-containing protein [Daejeonella sp.]|uniref:DUF5683 domain-containing protein n=1 Tax=Daejeonella sp. TaxID=2805397 RepID=UPI0025BA945B|nr:DUF5683 domain-containing protein [Daejeonella sp.]
MYTKILFGLLLMCFLAHGQAFSQIVEPSSARQDNSKKAIIKEPAIKDSARLAIEAMPRRAALNSALLPGLGQITNKRWWKVPLVYGGFVGIGLVFEFNQRYYKVFLKEAQFRQDNPGKTQNPLYAPYTTEGIISIKDSYRRNRDLSVLAGLGFYAINIIDAYVDAKFFRFDISDDLSVKVRPSLNQGPIHASGVSPVLGLKLKINL